MATGSGKTLLMHAHILQYRRFLQAHGRRFLARYVANRADSIEHIGRVLHEGLVTAAGRNLFAGRFSYLNTCGLTPAQIFDETLATLFNAPAGGALHVENLKGAAGEVAVRVGDNDPFGVINVGDDAKLVKLCEEKGLNVGEREFAGSLFLELGQPHSTINVLIGSKKLTEGWSSWRVSTTGLMNVGRGEGAQIIQLFGRGVRLRGVGMSLRRSARATLPEGLERPKHLAAAPAEALHVGLPVELLWEEVRPGVVFPRLRAVGDSAARFD